VPSCSAKRCPPRSDVTPTTLVYEYASSVRGRGTLSKIADEVDRTHERVHVTRNGREYVVLLSAEDLESLEATLGLLRDEAAMERVRSADASVAAGDVTTAVDMSALMGERRLREHRDR
jgi:antitoxin YefM